MKLLSQKLLIFVQVLLLSSFVFSAEEKNSDQIAIEKWIEQLDADIAKRNEGLVPYERIKKWSLVGEVWNEDNGCLTPTLKLKRRVIGERYKDQLKSFYA